MLGENEQIVRFGIIGCGGIARGKHLPENEWKELFSQYIPNWMVVTDTKAIKYFFESLQGGTKIP